MMTFPIISLFLSIVYLKFHPTTTNKKRPAPKHPAGLAPIAQNLTYHSRPSKPNPQRLPRLPPARVRVAYKATPCGPQPEANNSTCTSGPKAWIGAHRMVSASGAVGVGLRLRRGVAAGWGNGADGGDDLRLAIYD